MPSGFFGTFAGTMLRTKAPFASYSLMIGGPTTPATYQCLLWGTRTMDTGIESPPAPGARNRLFTGGGVTRCSGLSQSAALDGNGGENFGSRAFAGSGTERLPCSSVAGIRGAAGGV